MDCREAEKQITYFIQDELPDEETKEFLEHIRSCGTCRHELETNCFIVEGLRVLDSGGEEFDVSGTMERAIRRAYQRLRRRRLFATVGYAVDTLIAISVVVTALLECRILFWQ